MDNVSENLGLYDFFNVFGAGAIFTIHILLIFPNALKVYLNWMFNEKIALAGLIVLCYFFGLILQELAAFAEKHILKFKRKFTQNFLNDENIIENKIKMKQYRKYAKEILKNQKINIDKNYISPEQCGYVYAYIIYFIEHKGKDKKLEKMRALYGMSKLLFCCFVIIAVSCLVLLVAKNFVSIDSNTIILLILCAYSSTLIVFFYIRADRCMRYRVRMAMGVYESCINS